MSEGRRTKAQLTKEIETLRARVAELQRGEAAHKRAEEYLKGYQLAVESAHDAIFFKDLESRYVIANPKAVAALGLSREEVIGKNDYELMPDQEQARKNIEDDRRVFRTGKPREITKKMTGADGQEYWFEAIKVPQFDDGGRTVGLVGIARDITARTRAEEEIAKLTKFPSENPNPVLRIAKDGVILYSNDASSALLKVWHYQEGQALSGRWHRYVTEALHSGRRRQAEVECEGRIYFLTFAPVTEADYVNVYALDITKRKWAEEALRESEERYRVLFENSVDGISISKGDSVIAANQALLDLLGYKTVEEFAKVSVLDHVAPESRRMIQERRTARAKDLLLTSHYEYKIIRTNGETRDVETSTFEAPIGQDLLIQRTFRDITARKQAEQRLVTYQKQLRSLASELSLAEERERRRIAASLHDSVGQALALTKIRLEALKEQTSPDEPAQRMDDILDLLDEAIRDTHSLTFDLSPPILYELGFEPAAEWLTEQVQERHGLATVFADDAQPKPLGLDVRVLLFRALRELLVNVVKHAKAREVKVSVRRDADNIRITIEDDGTGFDPSALIVSGTASGGFGLFNIRERLRHLDGHFEIHSEVGQGTLATLIAPLDPGAQVVREGTPL